MIRHAKVEWMNKLVQVKRLHTVTERAGPRYSPDLNVELPLAFTFEALSRSPIFYSRFRAFLKEIHKKRKQLSRRHTDPSEKKEYKILDEKYDALFDLVESGSFIYKPRIQVALLAKIIKSCDTQTRKCRELLEKHKEEIKQTFKDATAPTKEEKDLTGSLDWEIRHLSELMSATWPLSSFLGEQEMRSANTNLLLMSGPAGIGKTHLFCDIAKKRLEKGWPTYIFLGEEFTSQDPLEAIRKLLKFNGTTTQLFQKINSYAKRRNTRALILVDALNENPQQVSWKVLAELEKYPYISVAVSVREGFEDSVLKKRDRARYLKITHYGFRFEQWSAVRKFFDQYKITFTEFPPLLPEFQNPLFLKIFCQVHKKYNGKVMGNGATIIFEEYTDFQGQEFMKKMGIAWTGGPNPIWENIIKEMAIWMATNKAERIPEPDAKLIIENYLPSQSSLALLNLEKCWLLTKIPHYDSNFQVTGFDYRFPYQRFSDHLIVRYLLKQYLPEYKNKPKKLFSTGPFSHFFTETYKYSGLIEALSVQIPERFNGRDLIELIPSSCLTDEVVQKAFLQSLVWREVKVKNGAVVTFRPASVMAYVRKFLQSDKYTLWEFLDTLLTVASIPKHPLNAFFLDKVLKRKKMPKRDALWIPFMSSTYGDGSAIDRIIEWSWDDNPKLDISSESLELLCVALGWFLCSSQRVLRDSATKALSSLLSNDLKLSKQLLERFKSIDDPYIAERLYGAVYGACLIAKDKKPLKDLGVFVYTSFFIPKPLTTHILQRDYARGIVELAQAHYPNPLIDLDKVRPPYKSNWPRRITSLKALEKKYEQPPATDENMLGYSSIKYSVLGGDFGRYTLSSRVGHWRSRNLTGRKKLTPKEVTSAFEGTLSRSQKELWKKWIKAGESARFVSIFRYVNSVKGVEEPSVNEKDLLKSKKDAEGIFVKSLTPTQKKIYYDIAKPFTDGKLRQNLSFDENIAKRWVLERVLKLGWSPNLHGTYDRKRDSLDRSPNKSERIGKKYQWIALHEFLGLLADNFEYGDSYNPTSVYKYDNPSEIYTRDIDPSCLLKAKAYRDQYKNPSKDCWWVPKFSSWGLTKPMKKWASSIKDVPSLESFCFSKDKDGREWVVLDGGSRFVQPFPHYEETYDRARRELWLWFNSFLVKNEDADVLFNLLSSTKSTFSSGLPFENRHFNHFFLREFPTYLAYKHNAKTYFSGGYWERKLSGIELPAPVMPTIFDYSTEEDDTSIENFHLSLPIKPIFDGMGLKFIKDGYLGRGSEVIAFDPSINIDGPTILAIDKKEMLKFLKKKGYTLMWFSIGEKLMVGGGEMGGGRDYLRFFGVNYLKSNGHTKETLVISPKPNQDQS